MAKKKAKSGAPATSAAPAAATQMTAVDAQVQAAFDAGNFAAVRALARAAPTPLSDKLAALTQVERLQIGVGVAAVGVTLIVMLVTLRG